MSGPKYGCAKLDMKVLERLRKELSQHDEPQRQKMLRERIERVLAATDEMLNNAPMNRYRRIAETNHGAKMILEEIDLISSQKFSLDGNSNELIVTLYVYEEKRQKLEELLGLLKEAEAGGQSAEEKDSFSYERKKIVKTPPESEKKCKGEEFGQLGAEDMQKEAFLLKEEYFRLAKGLEKSGEPPKALPMLRMAVNAMREELDQKLTAEYTAKAVDEVLAEMGYQVAEHIVTEQKGRSHGYYHFSGASVLSVASSENGAVLFEVMSREKNPTSLEKEMVKEDMERFCPDYFIIREKLREKGVILEQERLCPADVKYVRGASLTEKPKEAECSFRKKAYYDESGS